MNSRMLERYLMELGYACQNVQDLKLCDECPLVLNNCLEDSSVLFTAENINADIIANFMEFAKSCEPDEEDYLASCADIDRKAEQEERMIEYGDYI